MQGIGVMVVVLGLLALLYGVYQKLRAGRVADAPLVPTGHAAHQGAQVAGPKGQISAQGSVICPMPIVSPVTGTSCLFWKVTTTARWMDGSTPRSEIIDSRKGAAGFAIDDGSGAVEIDAREGGDFEPNMTKKETKGAGLLKGLLGRDLIFGTDYRVNTIPFPLDTKYTVEEEVLPVVARVYACGRAQNGTIASPNWRQLILSDKSRDQILSKATHGAKMFLVGGAVAMILGLGVGITGRILDEDKPSTTASSSDVDPWAASKASAAAAPTAPPVATVAPEAPKAVATVANAKAPKAKPAKPKKK